MGTTVVLIDLTQDGMKIDEPGSLSRVTDGSYSKTKPTGVFKHHPRLPTAFVHKRKDRTLHFTVSESACRTDHGALGLAVAVTVR